MVLRRHSVIGLALAVAVIASWAPAQDLKQTVDAVFKTCDQNSNQTIELGEVKSVLQEYMSKLVAAGGDQPTIDKLNEEYGYALQLEQFLRGDADDNGTLTKAELTNFIGVMANPEQQTALCADDCDILGRLTIELEWSWLLNGGDADGDGKFSKVEWLGGMPNAAEATQFNESDADKDGCLDMAEAQEYQARKVLGEHGFKKSDVKGTFGAATQSGGAGSTGSSGGGETIAHKFKVGTSWVIKSDAGGMVTHMKYKVTAVDGGKVSYTVNMLDASMNSMGVPTQTLEADFGATGTGTGTPTQGGEATVERTTLELVGRSWDCWHTSVMGTESWSSIDYPLIPLKATSAHAKLELIEFSE